MEHHGITNNIEKYAKRTMRYDNTIHVYIIIVAVGTLLYTAYTRGIDMFCISYTHEQINYLSQSEVAWW